MQLSWLVVHAMHGNALHLHLHNVNLHLKQIAQNELLYIRVSVEYITANCLLLFKIHTTQFF